MKTSRLEPPYRRDHLSRRVERRPAGSPLPLLIECRRDPKIRDGFVESELFPIFRKRKSKDNLIDAKRSLFSLFPSLRIYPFVSYSFFEFHLN